MYKFWIRILLPAAIGCFLASNVAYADQCAWISESQAAGAQGILTLGTNVIEYCEPCDDRRPGAPFAVNSVRQTTPSDGYREISINGRNVDLAYTFVQVSPTQYENLAMLVGCPVTSVSKTLTVVGQTPAQVLSTPSVRELRVGGGPVAGTLSEGEEIWYHVTVAENSVLTVGTIGGRDTYLEAYKAYNGLNLLAENDDGGEDTNARIEMLVAAGQYMFKLRGHAQAAGPFHIFATSEPVPTPVELRFGTTHKANLTPGVRHLYSVRARDRGRITTETFGDIDTYMEAYDSQYNLVASDDDSGVGLNALIEMSVEPGQVVLFRLRGISNETAGPYEIAAKFEAVSAVTAQPGPSNEAIRVIQPLANSVNNLLHRSLAAGEKHYYRVNNLTDSFYYVMWRDSDSNKNLNAPFADIKITILNITNNSVIVSGADVDRSLNEEGEINSIEIIRNTHYTNGNDILVIVEGFNSDSSGSYAIIVY